MKTLIVLPAFALMMVSCNKNGDQAVTDASAVKIAALEQQLEQQKLAAIKQNAIDSMQMINELKLPMAIEAAPIAPVRTRVVYRERKNPVTEAPSTQAPTSSPPIVADSSTGENSAETSPAPTPQPEKKGWSNTAKGAVIGAGVGAVGGAVINKKDRVKGAVIGAVIGGAAGAGTGIILDRKKKRESEFIY